MQIIIKIVNGTQAKIGEFMRTIEMTQVTARIRLAGHTAAFRIDRIFIGCVIGFFDVDFTKTGEECAVSGIAGGHHAVKHVDTPQDIFYQVFGSANPHEIAGFIDGHEGGCPFHRIIHRLIGFTDT